MNYLSFDIGIKNLAYCEISPDKKILQWGILNLNENPICCMHLKKPCDKQSSHCIVIGNIENYYCSSHINHKSLETKDKKIKQAGMEEEEIDTTINFIAQTLNGTPNTQRR